MAKTQPACSASTRVKAEALLNHLIILVVQANEQLAQLSLLRDTRASLDGPPEAPPLDKDILSIASQDAQRAVLKQTLNDEMRRQLRVLSLTVDALYDCTDRMTSLSR